MRRSLRRDDRPRWPRSRNSVGTQVVNTSKASPRLVDLLRAAADVTARAVKRHATTQEIQRLTGLVATQGDPSRGETLFRSANMGCLRCHAIAGTGGKVGPDLSAIGTTAQVDFLIEHI